jgi:hypothetical protein
MSDKRQVKGYELTWSRGGTGTVVLDDVDDRRTMIKDVPAELFAMYAVLLGGARAGELTIADGQLQDAVVSIRRKELP